MLVIINLNSEANSKEKETKFEEKLCISTL